MSATPTGADAMKEADLKPCPFCNLSHTLKVTSAQALAQEGEDDPEPWTHSDSYAVMCDARRPDGPGGCGASGGFFSTEANAIAAWNRRAPVEAQPAAVPSADALAVADAAGWDRAIKEGMREIEAERAAPAAPLVGEPSQQPVAFYEQEPKGQSYKLFWTVPGLGVPAGAVPLYASPAAPAGVPRHVCGQQGYNGMIDPPCPACERNSFHLPACDSSEASGSAIPARPTLPGEMQRWHELKTDPEVFDAVASGLKTHEIRKNDRGFQVGDGLLLRRTKYTGAQMHMRREACPLEYTGEECRRVVSHVLSGYGLDDGWVILSFAAGGDQKAAPLHPSSVQAVDGDEGASK